MTQCAKSNSVRLSRIKITYSLTEKNILIRFFAQLMQKKLESFELFEMLTYIKSISYKKLHFS